ncbi:MAG TPA: NADH-quinone oxidoreductase subunit J, partial [Vicinamibacterales bacterium]
MELVLFYLFAGLLLFGAIGVVAQRNPMHSVLFLVLAFISLAALYIQLDSPFAAVIQIIVYTGAIMVLFLFVVMLL